MPVTVQLDYDRGVPIYRQITDAILGALTSGELEKNEQLPTIHELARRLGVNPNTVARAYRDLERDGHIVAQRGKGTFPALKPPKPRRKQSTLRGIFEQAVGEAARHRISAREVVNYFNEALDDPKKTR